MPAQVISGYDIPTEVPIEKLTENIKANQGKLVGVDLLGRWNSTIALVGGGPSLAGQIEELKKYSTVMVCGSAYDYVMSQGILPEYCVICDADPLVLQYVKTANDYTKFLIASQCAPEVFEYFKEYEAYVWHANGSGFEENLFQNAPLVGGGCTVGTRAIMLAMGLGYYEQHLFGYDTCLTDDYKHHAYDFQTEDESIGTISEIKIDNGANKKLYKVAGYMLGQIFDFQEIMRVQGHKLRFTIHGEGVLKDIMDLATIKAKEVMQNGRS